MEITIETEGEVPDDFPVKCPKCGNINRFKFEEIKPGTVKKCGFCPAEFKFTGDDLTALGEAFKSLRDTLKRFGDTGK